MTAALGNGYDQSVIRNYVREIERFIDDLASERGAYMQRCKAIREQISDIYDAAKEQHGIPRKAFKKLVQVRELERKIESSIAKLEDDDRQTYEMLEQALGDFGDTPLGQATLAAKRAQETPSTIDIPTQPAQRPDEEYLKNLGRGPAL